MNRIFALRSSLFLAAALLCSGVVLTSSPAEAYNSDAALERDGAQCTRQVARSERQYGIPQRLLAAMAATETGRRHKGLGVQIPWPWTINVEGKPYFFDTKREVVAAVANFQRQGITSIDVGCMQINLHHHPHAFSNLEQAFDPRYNVDYAARFLRGHYDETLSWKTAVGRYHSRTPAHATRYIGAVYGQWYGLASKAAGTQTATAPAKSRYKSFVQVGSSGEQTVFNDPAQKSSPRKIVTPVTPKDEHIIKTASRENVRRDFELSIIRPASNAGKIETAPTQSSDASNPLVMNSGEAKPFTSAKVMAISANGKTSDDNDSRFVRFVD